MDAARREMVREVFRRMAEACIAHEHLPCCLVAVGEEGVPVEVSVMAVGEDLGTVDLLVLLRAAAERLAGGHGTMVV